MIHSNKRQALNMRERREPMDIDASSIISVTEANQNFSRIVKMVEANGSALIFKRNKPRYLMLDVNNSDAIRKAYKQLAGKKK